MKKAKLLPFIGIAISAVFLYIALRNIEFSKMGAALKLTDYRIILAAALVYVVTFFIRGLRWKFILQSVKSCRVTDMFFLVSIAFFANNVLPLRMGEFVGAYVNAKKHDISNSASFATVAVSRVFDGLSLIVFAVFLIIYLGLSGGISPEAIVYLKEKGPYIVLLFLVAFLFLFGMISKRELTIRITRKVFFFIPENILNRIAGILDSFIGGLKVLHTPKDLLLTIVSSLSIWIVEATTFYMVSVALGLNLTYSSAALVMVIVAFGVLMPSSPGFVGVYELACIIGLGIFGTGKDMALTFALLIHSMQFIVIILLGIISMSRENLTLMDIKKRV